VYPEGDGVDATEVWCPVAAAASQRPAPVTPAAALRPGMCLSADRASRARRAIVDRDRIGPNQTWRHDDLRNQHVENRSMHPPARHPLRPCAATPVRSSAVSGEACLA